MRMFVEAKPRRYIVAGRLIEKHQKDRSVTIEGEIRYRDGTEKTVRLRLLCREGQQLPDLGEYVLARILPGEVMLEYIEERFIKPDILYAMATDIRPWGESYHFRANSFLEEEHIFSGRIAVQSMTAGVRNGKTTISFRLQDGCAVLAASGKKVKDLLQMEEGVFVTGPKDRHGEYKVKRIKRKE